MLVKVTSVYRWFGMRSARAAALVAASGFGLISAHAAAQDQNVPFTMQEVGDQVVNGVLIQGARVPVWSDQSGRAGGRPSAAQRDMTNESELNDLARIGLGQKSSGVGAAARATTPVAPLTTRPKRNGPEFEVVDDDAPVAPTSAVLRKRTRSDDDELAELEKEMERAQSEYRRKQRQVEARKKDEERRVEEARKAVEREAARQRLVFKAKSGQLLSEAISAYVGQNGWENVEWNVGPDFQIKYNYAERPREGEKLSDVLQRVLEPYGLSASLHRPNSVVEIYQSSQAQHRK